MANAERDHGPANPEDSSVYFKIQRGLLVPAGSETEQRLAAAERRLAFAAGELGIRMTFIWTEQLAVTLLRGRALRRAYDRTRREDLTLADLRRTIARELPDTFAGDALASPIKGFSAKAGKDTPEIGGVYGIIINSPVAEAERDRIGHILNRETVTDTSIAGELRLTLATSPEQPPIGMDQRTQMSYLNYSMMSALHGHELTLRPVDFPPAAHHEL